MASMALIKYYLQWAVHPEGDTACSAGASSPPRRPVLLESTTEPHCTQTQCKELRTHRMFQTELVCYPSRYNTIYTSPKLDVRQRRNWHTSHHYRRLFIGLGVTLGLFGEITPGDLPL